MITLDYIQDAPTKGEYLRTQYLNIMGFKTPEEKLKSLDELLRIKHRYHPVDICAENTVIAFGVGNGNDSDLCTQSTILTSNSEFGCTNVILEIPEDNDKIEYLDEHLKNILPLIDFDSRIKPNPNYHVFIPSESLKTWYRRMYLKESVWTTQIVNEQDSHMTNLQVVCKLDKNDLKTLSGTDSISELCLYTGSLVNIFDAHMANYPTSYFRDATPSQDMVNVYPFLKVQFEPISVAKIHATGLMFVFNIQKDKVDVVVENPPENDPENSDQNPPEIESNAFKTSSKDIPTKVSK